MKVFKMKFSKDCEHNNHYECKGKFNRINEILQFPMSYKCECKCHNGD